MFIQSGSNHVDRNSRISQRLAIRKRCRRRWHDYPYRDSCGGLRRIVRRVKCDRRCCHLINGYGCLVVSLAIRWVCVKRRRCYNAYRNSTVGKALFSRKRRNRPRPHDIYGDSGCRITLESRKSHDVLHSINRNAAHFTRGGEWGAWETWWEAATCTRKWLLSLRLNCNRSRTDSHGAGVFPGCAIGHPKARR